MRKQMRNFLAVVQVQNSSLFAILRCCKSSKKVFMHGDRALGIKQFYIHGH